MDIPSTRSEDLYSTASKNRSGERLMKLMALTVVAVMVAAGFVMLAPALKSDHDQSQTAPEENQASIAVSGTHYLNTTISNMFESYQKVTTPTGGFQTGTPGINDWWALRQAYYGDVILRNQYPYVIGIFPYSAEVPPAGLAIPTMKYGLYSFYRTTIDSSITTIGTGPGMPLGFVPILGTPWTTYSAMSGGWVNWSYYLTYATSADIAAAQAGTGYMNRYYGVTPAQFQFAGANANDGWYVDFQGKVDFNRDAAKKFLGLTGSADLRSQFIFNNTGSNLGKMNASWSAFWTRDGGSGPTGYNDTYCAYDYSLDAYPIRMFLSVDPVSTANKLVLRIYGIAWGVEILVLRYMDRAGIYSKGMASPEDWYLNGTASPYGTDIKSRMVCVYSMLAWKDTGFFSPAWYLDFMHIDYAPNSAMHPGWLSRYNPYMATKTYKPTYMTWSPGTLTYGTGCAYPYPPMNYNLLANEKLVVKLPDSSRSVAGYMPYKGVGTTDTLTVAKLAELNSHLVWGEIGLGSTFPTTLRSAMYYDHATKTLTLTGPMTLARNPNTAFPLLNATGSPSFSFDVMRVSDYSMAIVEAVPYNAGQTYHLQLTAKNVTGATVTDWNGTVALSQNGGVLLGASYHTFVPADAGVWTTTIQFSDPSLWRVDATDSWFPLDVTETLQQGGLNRPPVAFINSVSPNPALQGQTINFAGSGIAFGGTIAGWTWREGNSILSTSASFSTASLTPGLHQIYFSVTDSSGLQSNDAYVLVTVQADQPPVAVIDSASPNPCQVGGLVSFVGHGTDSDGYIIAWKWREGNNVLSTSASFSTSSLSLGTHTLYFSVEDNAGLWSNEVSVTVSIVSNQPPIATITQVNPNPADVGSWVNFSGQGTDADGYIVAYRWYEGSTILSTTQSFSTNSLLAGTHTIGFMVQDNGGLWSDPVSVTVTIVPNQPPIATITQVNPNPADVGSWVYFYGQGADADGYIVAYRWYEGSTVLCALQNFATNCLLAGTHTIGFMVQDNGGRWSDPVSVTVTIVLPNTPPTAVFTFSPATAGIEVPFSFDASASYDLEDGYGLQYRWDFNGDGVWDEGGTNSSMASYIYHNAGSYQVKLQVMDSMGAIGTCTHVLTVLREQAFPSVYVYKTVSGLNSVSWKITALHSGVLTISLANQGFKSVVVEVHDVTTKDVKVFQKTIVFSKYKAYPIGIATCSLNVIAGHTYTIILKQFDGPVGSSMTATPKITW